jgi:hypothetical protein
MLQLLASDPQSVAECCLSVAASLSTQRRGTGQAVVLQAADLGRVSVAFQVVAGPLRAVSSALELCSSIQGLARGGVQQWQAWRLQLAAMYTLGVIMHVLHRWLGGLVVHTRVCVAPIGCERLGARCLGQR